MSVIIFDTVDPVIDFVQKEAMLRYFDFSRDAGTPIELAFTKATEDLAKLSETVAQVTSNPCLNREGIQRKLQREYSNFTSAVNNCTRALSSSYRTPINDFTRIHFQAQPLLVRIGSNITRCATATNRDRDREACVIKFLETICADPSVCETVETM